MSEGQQCGSAVDDPQLEVSRWKSDNWRYGGAAAVSGKSTYNYECDGEGGSSSAYCGSTQHHVRLDC